MEILKERAFWGREKENLIYPIALANLVLHGIDRPNLWHGNTLTGQEIYGGLFEGAPPMFDVILTYIKVRKKKPLTLKHFDNFFKLLHTLADSELSWTVDLDERKKSAAVEARPFKEGATKKFQEAAQWKERLKELKKTKSKDEKDIQEANTKVKALTKESKSLANKAKEIENAVYDLKAVNPNKKPVIDIRTPEELLGIIENKGKEVAEALAFLRKNMDG